MYEKLKKAIIGILFTVVTALCICGWVRYGISQRHLEQSRYELGQVREQLEQANSRESDIAASLGRTNEILSESISTVAELREAFGIIRKEFENMQNILRSDGRGGNSNDDNDNHIVDTEIESEGVCTV